MLAYHFRRVLNTCLPGSTGRGLGLESGWWICTHSSNSSGDNMGLYRYGLMYFVSAVFSVRRTLLFCDVWNGWKRKVQCQRYWLSVWPANWVWPANCFWPANCIYPRFVFYPQIVCWPANCVLRSNWFFLISNCVLPLNCPGERLTEAALGGTLSQLTRRSISNRSDIQDINKQRYKTGEIYKDINKQRYKTGEIYKI